MAMVMVMVVVIIMVVVMVFQGIQTTQSSIAILPQLHHASKNDYSAREKIRT